VRNAWRVLAFDIAAPLTAIGALLAIGFVLAWPRWWVSVCSVLVLLIVEGVALNAWLAHRDSVTVGTDDDAPGLRFGVVGLCTVAVLAAVLTGYTHWTVPDRTLKTDSADVVRISIEMAEATVSLSPQQPMASIDRAAALMVREQATAFKDQFGKAAADLARRNVSVSAQTLEAGLVGIGPAVASVSVILRASQNEPGQPTSTAVLSLLITLTKQSDHWLVLGLAPLNAR
jgi:hypothetical protein